MKIFQGSKQYLFLLLLWFFAGAIKASASCQGTGVYYNCHADEIMMNLALSGHHTAATLHPGLAKAAEEELLVCKYPVLKEK